MEDCFKIWIPISTINFGKMATPPSCQFVGRLWAGLPACLVVLPSAKQGVLVRPRAPELLRARRDFDWLNWSREHVWLAKNPCCLYGQVDGADVSCQQPGLFLNFFVKITKYFWLKISSNQQTVGLTKFLTRRKCFKIKTEPELCFSWLGQSSLPLTTTPARREKREGAFKVTRIKSSFLALFQTFWDESATRKLSLFGIFSTFLPHFSGFETKHWTQKMWFFTKLHT